jgi:hypothetical protein
VPPWRVVGQLYFTFYSGISHIIEEAFRQGVLYFISGESDMFLVLHPTFDGTLSLIHRTGSKTT